MGRQASVTDTAIVQTFVDCRLLNVKDAICLTSFKDNSNVTSFVKATLTDPHIRINFLFLSVPKATGMSLTFLLWPNVYFLPPLTELLKVGGLYLIHIFIYPGIEEAINRLA